MESVKQDHLVLCPQLIKKGEFGYKEFTFTETLHGDIPKGVMKFGIDDSGAVKEDVIDIEIYISSSRLGNPYYLKISAHVYNITTDNEYVYYHIMLCKRDFITQNRVRYLGDDMNKVISSVYNHTVNSDTMSNIISHPFHQSNMTDYNYLKSILSSYNQNITWGFSCEGLSIKSVNADPKYKDYKHGYSGNATKNPAVLNSKFIELPEPEVTEFTYFTSSNYNGVINYTKLDDREFEVNRKSNIKYQMTPLFTVTIPYGEFPPFDLGDVVNFDRKMIVHSRKLTMKEALKVEVTYALYSKN